MAVSDLSALLLKWRVTRQVVLTVAPLETASVSYNYGVEVIMYFKWLRRRSTCGGKLTLRSKQEKTTGNPQTAFI